MIAWRWLFEQEQAATPSEAGDGVRVSKELGEAGKALHGARGVGDMEGGMSPRINEARGVADIADLAACFDFEEDEADARAILGTPCDDVTVEGDGALSDAASECQEEDEGVPGFNATSLEILMGMNASMTAVQFALLKVQCFALARDVELLPLCAQYQS